MGAKAESTPSAAAPLGGSVLEALAFEALRETPGSPGIVRRKAFDGEGFQILRALVEPGVSSGWHHHGGHDVYGFLASGTARLEGGPGGRDVVAVAAGSFFHVPAHTVHRDINPSEGEPKDFVLVFIGSGPVAVNVEGPVPE